MKHKHDFCDFVDNRNGDTCEEKGTIDVENLGIIDYYRACPKHAKYLKRLIKRKGADVTSVLGIVEK